MNAPKTLIGKVPEGYEADLNGLHSLVATISIVHQCPAFADTVGGITIDIKNASTDTIALLTGLLSQNNFQVETSNS